MVPVISWKVGHVELSHTSTVHWELKSLVCQWCDGRLRVPTSTSLPSDLQTSSCTENVRIWVGHGWQVECLDLDRGEYSFKRLDSMSEACWAILLRFAYTCLCINTATYSAIHSRARAGLSEYHVCRSKNHPEVPITNPRFSKCWSFLLHLHKLTSRDFQSRHRWICQNLVILDTRHIRY